MGDPVVRAGSTVLVLVGVRESPIHCQVVIGGRVINCIGRPAWIRDLITHLVLWGHREVDGDGYEFTYAYLTPDETRLIIARTSPELSSIIGYILDPQPSRAPRRGRPVWG